MLLATASRSAARTTLHGTGRRAASAIALKYSHAVYGAALAKSPQTLTKVASELAAVSKTLAADAKVSEFFSNPTLSVQERATGLEALYSGIDGGKLSDVTKNLLKVLSENGRLGETPGVIEGFNELFSQYKGEVNVTVTSATPLPKDVLTRLEATLKQSQTAQAAKVLKVTNKVRVYPSSIQEYQTHFTLQVNPALLGGLVVDFGEKTIDLSVQSRVTKLNNILQRMFLLQLYSSAPWHSHTMSRICLVVRIDSSITVYCREFIHCCRVPHSRRSAL